MNSYALVGSEALSEEFNDLASFYSDYHKDVYGFRPRGMALCADMYEDEGALKAALVLVKENIETLDLVAPGMAAQEELETKRMINMFEQLIYHYINLGAGTRAKAIEWLCQAHCVENTNDTYGWEHLEYLMGIPFGYIAKSLVTH